MKQLTLEEYRAQLEIETEPLLARRLELAQAHYCLTTHEEKMASYEESRAIWKEIGAIVERLKAQMIPSELVRLETIAANKGLVAPSFSDEMIDTMLGVQGTIH